MLTKVVVGIDCSEDGKHCGRCTWVGGAYCVCTLFGYSTLSKTPEGLLRVHDCLQAELDALREDLSR